MALRHLEPDSNQGRISINEGENNQQLNLSCCRPPGSGLIVLYIVTWLVDCNFVLPYDHPPNLQSFTKTLVPVTF